MTRIVETISIRRPVTEVYDYATTPSNWPAWHPASRSVSGQTDHSLLIGEEVTEEFIAAGRQGSCVWQVTRREAPHLWTIATSTPQIRADITYRLTAHGDSTIFERELAYEPSGIWFKLLDFLVMRRRMEQESRTALERLKERLERPVSGGLA